ncbi:MAG TPA: hypothetical protein VJS15_07705 [Allosphingosinicella sp.]|nr:hypothetical protein [Allosphingosinicella sp.]
MIDDERIAALFAASERAPDEVFVARIARDIAEERRVAAARRAAWRRFAVETVASASVIAAFWLLWRLGPAELAPEEIPMTPAGIAVIILLLWFAIELRPAATGR